MARSFASASSQYLEKTGLSFSSPPYTIACWFKVTTFNTGVMVSLDGATGNWIFELYATSGSKLGFYAEPNGPGAVNLVGGTTLSSGTWYHAAAVTTAGDHQFWLNGSSEGTSTLPANITGATQVHVSANRYSGAIGSYLNGQVCEVGVWNARLTTAEVASLARGFTPLEIRPALLVAYYPLGGHHGQFDLDRWKNKHDLTPSGSPTWADHPRVIYPDVSFAPIKATVASSTKYWTFARQATRIIGGGIGT